MCKKVWTLCLIVLTQQIACQQANRSFVIDYENNQFLMDNTPFRYVAGEMEYFRVPHQYWTDRFAKMRAGGINVVQTYVEWNSHQPQPGIFIFDQNLDLISFIQQANSSGLYVIIRAGPYIDAARDMGGLPSWLLQLNPSINLRTSDPTYLHYVDEWFNYLLPMLRPYLYENGGPIISLQVENEYGSYPACDFDYMYHLRDKFIEILGNTVVLFTTDGNADYFMTCGKISGLYATIDFGPGENVTESFEVQRRYEPQGPLVNSEFYTGWDDFWGYSHSETATPLIQNTLDQMLAMNASVSFYMYTGGTSYGFTNGAIDNLFTIYITSYDYNAPISEAGDTTEKFMAIRNTIDKYLPVPSDPIPANTSKYAYGPINMNWIGSFFDILQYAAILPPISGEWPLSFEDLGQTFGYVLYETVIKTHLMQPEYLSIPKIADRGYVFINKMYAGILSRVENITQVPIKISINQTLSILVENQGRVAYGPTMNDFKGIRGLNSVLIGGKALTDWTMTLIPFNGTSISQLDNYISKMLNGVGRFSLKDSCSVSYPGMFHGEFYAGNGTDQPMDTFLDLTNWSKGIAFINGFHLGRYWTVVGPQITLFVSKYLIKSYPEANQIVIFEHESSPCQESRDSCTVQLIDKPILAGNTPYLSKNMDNPNPNETIKQIVMP